MDDVIYPWVEPVIARLPATASALPRALLLTGRQGLGKRATALFLARALLCEKRRNVLPACGACASCLLYDAGNHPDLRVIEVGQEEEGAVHDDELTPPKKASRHISVEKIRALAELVTITAHRGGAKVICLMPAEAMLPAAANAVLKVLEEPPGDTYFLLTSDHPERLLPTIRSRCFNLAFGVPETQSALAWLKGQGMEHAELALAQAGYAPLGALERAADEAFWIQRKKLLDVLSAPQFNFFQAADCAEEFDGPLISRLLSQWAYDITTLRAGGKVRYHLDYASALQKIATGVAVEKLLEWYDCIIQFSRVAQHPLNKRLAMESLLFAYPGRE